MSRKKIDPLTETLILTDCKRKCALCVGLNGDYSEKRGQIAHLDKNNSNNQSDNLCFLCLDHHTSYDSISSQHKNYTINEVKQYRDRLIEELKNKSFEKKPTRIANLLKPYFVLFNGINSLIDINISSLSDYKEFIIETAFLIPNNNYAGVLLNVSNSKKDIFLYLSYSSIKHPTNPNRLSLQLYRHGESTELLSFSEEFTKWNTIVIKYTIETLSMAINDRESSIRLTSSKWNFDKIEIGGTKFNNSNYDKSKRQPIYSYSQFQFFRILSKSDLVLNVDFSYGKEYGLKLIGRKDVKLYGGLIFIDTVNKSFCEHHVSDNGGV